MEDDKKTFFERHKGIIIPILIGIVLGGIKVIFIDSNDSNKFSVDDLSEEYVNNAARANKDYVGESIKVTGYVYQTKEDAYGEPYIILRNKKDTSRYNVEVHMVYDESQFNKIYNMDEGDKITIEGTVAGNDSFAVLIGDAEIL